MFQHEESDEDDYEGYFLQPVNGYNIADRIISANKELFESESVQSGNFSETQRKVSFRPEPDYEPDESEPEVDDVSSCDNDDIAAINQVLDRRDDIVVFEDEKVMETNNAEVRESEVISNCEKLVENEVEEICEEIGSVDLGANDESEISKIEDAPDEIQPINLESKLIECKNSAADMRPKVSKSSRTTKPKVHQPKPNSAKVKHSEPSQHHNHYHRPNSSVHAKQSPESQFLKIQLNFKPCCEYKYLENDRLPRYCGYISAYGMTKEQLELREKRRERYRNRQTDKTAKQLQEETIKSEVNEAAFVRWLQNKMRSSRNMTKNMYDYRPSKQAKKGKKNV